MHDTNRVFVVRAFVGGSLFYDVGMSRGVIPRLSFLWARLAVGYRASRHSAVEGLAPLPIKYINEPLDRAKHWGSMERSIRTQSSEALGVDGAQH